MKFVKAMGFIVTFFLAVYCGQAYAQSDDSSINIGVYVRGEENLNRTIEDYVSKELKNLGNTVVTFSQLDCAIDVVVKKLNDGNRNEKGGYALSVTIVDRVDSVPIARVIEKLDIIVSKIKAQPVVIKQLEEISKELVGVAVAAAKIKSYQNNFLYTGSLGQLRKLCTKIVNDFNNEYLKGKRKVIRRRYF